MTVVQGNSAPASIASDKPSGVVGRTKWHAWFKQKGQSFDIIPSRSPELGERSCRTCNPAAVQISVHDAACCRDEARACETPGASAASRIEKIAIQVMTLPGRWAGFNLGAADGSMRLHAVGATRAIDRHTGRRRRDCAGRVHRQFCGGEARPWCDGPRKNKPHILMLCHPRPMRQKAACDQLPRDKMAHCRTGWFVY